MSSVIAHDLTVAYATRPVLWDIDLNIPEKKLVSIVGPNGAGKTTLIKTMLNLLKPISGEVKVKEGLEIAYVPQSGSVDWDYPASALDVVLMGRSKALGWIRRAKKKDRDLAVQMLDKMGIKELAHRQINQLSGGQQQRVFLARALIQNADIYFMDEPFKGVDAQTEKQIIQLLRDLRDAGKTVIAVHHDLQTVKEYFDWSILINIKVVAAGEVDEIFTEENIIKTYRSSVDWDIN